MMMETEICRLCHEVGPSHPLCWLKMVCRPDYQPGEGKAFVWRSNRASVGSVEGVNSDES